MECGGSGRVASAMKTPLGVFQQVSSCPNCQGTGETYIACDTCQGDGRISKRKRIQVQIPAGPKFLLIFIFKKLI